MNACLIAIVGGSGSGKSWLADRLQQEFRQVAGRLCLDDYYQDLSHLPPGERKQMNFDQPKAIDWPRFRGDLALVRAGQAAALPAYDFATQSRLRRIRPWQPRELVFVDGLWLLHYAAVRRLFSLSVYVECSEALRFKRRLKRDQQERGWTAPEIRRQFQTQVEPNHRRFVAPQKEMADLVVDSPIAAGPLRQIITRCRKFLQVGGPS